ncbi:hypothetical protein [Kangiella japonica]|uniref:hypothetical protein n=1 Tax=Kangiella japonica TaxID=647384 RepID=UPI0031D6997A
MGFNYEMQPFRYAASLFLTFLFVFTLSAKLRKFSDFVFLMFYLSVLIPLLSIWGLDPSLESKALIYVLFGYLVSYLIVNLKSIKPISFPYFKNSELVTISVCLIAVLYLVLWYVLSGAIFNMNFDMGRVYEFRDENSATTNIGILAYLNVWTYKVFNIFAMSYFLLKRRYFVFCCLFLVQILFFGVSAHKAVFFFPFLVLFSYFYFRKRNSLLFIPFAFSLTCLFAFMLTTVFDSNLITSIMVRRLFYVPASTTFTYFEFADNFGHIYWSNSILTSVLEYQYDKPITYVIGDYILGARSAQSYLGANNGFLSSGYLHAGFIGVLFYSLIFGYILKIFDSLAKNGVPIWISISLTIIPFRDLVISSDLFTSLLTHGLLISMFILILFRNKKYISKDSL